jgi:hypothetical protein
MIAEDVLIFLCIIQMRHDSVKVCDSGQFINEFWTLSIVWNVCDAQMMMSTQMMVNSLSM